MINRSSSRTAKPFAVLALIVVLAASSLLIGALAIHTLAAPSVQPAVAPHAAAPLPPSGPGLYDDTDPQFAYSGVWTSGNTYPNAFQHTLHYSSDPKARARFYFHGTGFTLYRVTADSGGLMQIDLDGNQYQSVNNYAAATSWEVPLTINGLPDGVHLVEFINTSAKFIITIDALRILEGDAPQLTL